MPDRPSDAPDVEVRRSRRRRRTVSAYRDGDRIVVMIPATMTRAQTLQQAGTAILAQANAIPQNVLSLLR